MKSLKLEDIFVGILPTSDGGTIVFTLSCIFIRSPTLNMFFFLPHIYHMFGSSRKEIVHWVDCTTSYNIQVGQIQ